MNIPAQPLSHNQDLGDINTINPNIQAISEHITLGTTFGLDSKDTRTWANSGSDRLSEAGADLYEDAEDNMDPILQKVEQKLWRSTIFDAPVRQEPVYNHRGQDGSKMMEYAPVAYLVENGVFAGQPEESGAIGLNKEMMVAILELFSRDHVPQVYRGVVGRGGREIISDLDPASITIFGVVGNERQRQRTIMLEIQLGDSVHFPSAGKPNVHEHKSLTSIADKRYKIQRVRMFLPPERNVKTDDSPMNIK